MSDHVHMSEFSVTAVRARLEKYEQHPAEPTHLKLARADLRAALERIETLDICVKAKHDAGVAQAEQLQKRIAELERERDELRAAAADVLHREVLKRQEAERERDDFDHAESIVRATLAVVKGKLECAERERDEARAERDALHPRPKGTEDAALVAVRKIQLLQSHRVRCVFSSCGVSIPGGHHAGFCPMPYVRAALEGCA